MGALHIKTPSSPLAERIPPQPRRWARALLSLSSAVLVRHPSDSQGVITSKGPSSTES